MNIVYVAPFGLGHKSTVWARTLPLAAAVVASGHQAAIVVPPWDTPADSNSRSTVNGVSLIQVETRGGLPAIWRRMVAEVDARSPQIVHIVKPRAYAGLVQWYLWQRRRLPRQPKPTIILDVDDWEQAWAAINCYPAPVTRFLAWQEEWGIRHADAITAASRWLVARATAYRPETPTLYLPNGVTKPDETMKADAGHHRDECQKRDDQKTVLFFSRFVEITPSWLAAFWRALSLQQPGCRLIVAGYALQPSAEATYRVAMQAEAAEVAAAVTWTGRVDAATIAQLYRQADCAIFPAREEPLQQAKCSVRLATTLLHGVPVVASAVGEQASYGAAGAARLVPADASPERFAAIVGDVLSHQTARDQLAARAQDRLLNHYNWSRLGQELIDFYKQVAPHHE